MVYAQPRIYPGKVDVLNSLGFCGTKGSPILGQMTRLSYNQVKENLSNCRFCCPKNKIEKKAINKINTWTLVSNITKTVQHESVVFTSYNWCP